MERTTSGAHKAGVAMDRRELRGKKQPPALSPKTGRASYTITGSSYKTLQRAHAAESVDDYSSALLLARAVRIPRQPSCRFGRRSDSCRGTGSTTGDDMIALATAAIASGLAGLVWYRQPKLRAARARAHQEQRLAESERRYLGRAQMTPHAARESWQRLLRGAQARHPERGLLWCAERVLGDLERDRR
jgi:hypothetical protein